MLEFLLSFFVWIEAWRWVLPHSGEPHAKYQTLLCGLLIDEPTESYRNSRRSFDGKSVRKYQSKLLLVAFAGLFLWQPKRYTNFFFASSTGASILFYVPSYIKKDILCHKTMPQTKKNNFLMIHQNEFVANKWRPNVFFLLSATAGKPKPLIFCGLLR